MNTEDIAAFVLVASPRAGTTWLATALSEHPNIWVPPNKELNFFNEPFLSHWEFKYERGLDYYRGLFEDAPAGSIKGELTPTYYVDPNAVGRIRKHMPNAKILILVRNPAEVVYSTYLKSREHYPTSDSLEKEIEARPELLELGFYYRYLKRYFDAFPRDRIHVAVYEQFFADPAENISSVYRFLGADPDFVPTVLGRTVNPRRQVRHQWLIRLRHGIRRSVNSRPLLPLKRLLTRAVSVDLIDRKITEWNLRVSKLPPLSDSTRSWLMRTFESDICELEALIGIDLRMWREKQSPN